MAVCSDPAEDDGRAARQRRRHLITEGWDRRFHCSAHPRPQGRAPQRRSPTSSQPGNHAFPDRRRRHHTQRSSNRGKLERDPLPSLVLVAECSRQISIVRLGYYANAHNAFSAHTTKGPFSPRLHFPSRSSRDSAAVFFGRDCAAVPFFPAATAGSRPRPRPGAPLSAAAPRGGGATAADAANPHPPHLSTPGPPAHALRHNAARQANQRCRLGTMPPIAQQPQDRQANWRCRGGTRSPATASCPASVARHLGLPRSPSVLVADSSRCSPLL
jgi:hypothetical protein